MKAGVGSHFVDSSTEVTPESTSPKSKPSSAASNPSVAGRSPTTMFPGLLRSSFNQLRTRSAIGPLGFPAIVASVLPADATAAVNDPLPGSNPSGVG